MPAARRRSPRGDERRRQIVEGTLEAIRAQPVADVPLAAIATHVGLAPNHILYYFPSRDAVLIAAVEHGENALAEGRSERLRAVADPEERLAAYVREYLPDDRHDPVWKLWIEGWARSTSREDFGAVGSEANRRWRVDLDAALEHAVAAGASLRDAVPTVGRRLNILLDGIAIHVLAGHVTPAEGAEIAMGAIRSELRHQ
ncbi:MAG TPA: TetR family transcriptional regulator C-terminal domain-containing protein [Solirubrobacteraceae bacterium]|nr:TetR family transcriptional regulator C-terminal domain-containing protein [Solirubrobacteraceae bacterium]